METPSLNPEQNIGSAGSASPKIVYTLFVLSLAREYFSQIGTLDVDSIDRKTAALVAFVPDPAIREILWENYEKQRSAGNTLSASVYTVGAVITHFATILEWTDSATWGWI